MHGTSPLSDNRVDLISRTQSSELDLWMADILLSLVNVNRPIVRRLVSRCRTHETYFGHQNILYT